MLRRPRPVGLVTMAVALVAGVLAALVPAGPAPAASGWVGTDISWPQCHAASTAGYPFVVVGVTGGRPHTANPCLATQWAATAGSRAAVYVNVAYPRSTAEWTAGPKSCPVDDGACRAWNAGWGQAAAAVRTGAAGGVDAGTWWLDVETANPWSSNAALNVAVLQGAVAGLADAGRHVGVYSTPSMWAAITGGWSAGLPVWLAVGVPGSNPAGHCTRSFAGGPIAMVQWVAGDRDIDLVCGWSEAQAATLFDRGRPLWAIRSHPAP